MAKANSAQLGFVFDEVSEVTPAQLEHLVERAQLPPRVAVLQMKRSSKYNIFLQVPPSNHRDLLTLCIARDLESLREELERPVADQQPLWITFYEERIKAYRAAALALDTVTS